MNENVASAIEKNGLVCCGGKFKVLKWHLSEKFTKLLLTALKCKILLFAAASCNTLLLVEYQTQKAIKNPLNFSRKINLIFFSLAVLSGNRNFEGRIHPLTRANYLASPLLVIAYAIAGKKKVWQVSCEKQLNGEFLGTVDIDFETQPIGKSLDGREVYLRDIWPSRQEIQEIEKKYVIPAMFKDVYEKIQQGSQNWRDLVAPQGKLYPWDEKSTYIKHPPFFENMTRELPITKPIMNARVLLNLGDSVTTDHISPAGSIARNSPAGKLLMIEFDSRLNKFSS